VEFLGQPSGYSSPVKNLASSSSFTNLCLSYQNTFAFNKYNQFETAGLTGGPNPILSLLATMTDLRGKESNQFPDTMPEQVALLLYT
jgi:hypothetical protein